MAYQIIDAASVLRRIDGAGIPVDPTNRDYLEYLAWKQAGNTPDPAPVPAIVAPEDKINLGSLVRLLVNKGTIKKTDL